MVMGGVVVGDGGGGNWVEIDDNGEGGERWRKATIKSDLSGWVEFEEW